MLTLSVVVCLVCLFPVNGQEKFRVVEAETKAVFQEETAEISFVIESDQRKFPARITLELLDTKDAVRTQVTQSETIESGKESYRISLPLLDLMRGKSGNEIAWFRLRYQIIDLSSGRHKSAGIISLSEIIHDIFELRAAGAENVFPGMNYRARVRAVHPFTGKPVQPLK
jgi:hypothetical protein